MKKTLAVVLALVMLFSATFASAQMFADMEDAQWDWARDTVEELANTGIIKGYSDGTYGPANVLTHQEAFMLFARVLGVNDEANSDVVARALAVYKNTAAQYDTGAEKEICFMLYREILTEAELAEYLAEAVKNLPMQRYEVAKLITKVLDGDEEASKVKVSDYAYKDEAKFPETSKGYIAYVTENKIMSGMGDGTFSADTGVTRAQIAIILKRVMKMLSLSYVEGKAVGVSAYNIAVNGAIYEMNEDVVVYRDGKKATVKDVKNGDDVFLTVTYKGVLAIDATKSADSNDTETEIVEGVYCGAVTDETGTFLRVKLADGTEEKFPLADGTSYLINGKTKYVLSEVRETDAVRLSLINGGVINVVAKTRVIVLKDARALAVNAAEKESTVTLAHADEEYDGKALPIAQDAIIKRNDVDATVADIHVGDIMDVSVKYGVVIEIVASSKKEFVEGTLSAIHIEEDSAYVTVDMFDLTQRVVLMPADAVIEIDGAKSNLYGLRLGHTVSTTTENDVANLFYVNSKLKLTTLVGKVTLVNPNIGFFKMDVIDDETEKVTSYQIFVNEGTNIFQGVGGADVSFAALSEGDVLVVQGAENLGAFEATAIVIFEE